MNWLRKAIAAAVLISLSFIAFADPPLESGVVMRFDTAYGSFWADFENNTTTYFGLDLYEFCAGSQDFGIVSVMDVYMRGDGHRYKRHFSGDLFTTVWPGIAGPGAVCEQIFLGTGQPIATGMAYFRFNDNDVEPWLNPDRHNMNSFGFNANGTLYDFATGEPMRFMMYWHAMWDGIDEASFKEIFKSRLK